MKSPAPRPCESCPYRRDVPSGVWSAEEYEKLPAYDRDTWAQPGALFQCHQHDQEDGGARLCAGWVACHGQELLSLRLAIARDHVDPSVMDYTTDVEVFDSGTEAAAHGMKEIENISDDARRVINKISTHRTDLKEHRRGS